MDKTELAKNWISLQVLDQASSEAQALMWAAEEVNLLALRSPKECWDIILEIIEQTDDEWILTNVAAGPLENLLALNSEAVISFVEIEVRSNEKLKSILSGIWKNLIPDEIWERIQLLKT